MPGNAGSAASPPCCSARARGSASRIKNWNLTPYLRRTLPTLDSYLFFNGNCADATRFYERTPGGKIQAMKTYGEAPQAQQSPAGSGDRIMHARLEIDGRVLMASDLPAGRPDRGRSGFALSLSYPTAEEARRAFTALADGGTVTMPIQKTFWAEVCGMLTDRFGTAWMVGTVSQR